MTPDPSKAPPDEPSLAEFSAKAVIAGLVFGVIFGAANAYLGLHVGLTVSTSIPIAVLAVALFRVGSPLWGKSTILEANLAQTIGSASSSLATGTIFTIPALFLWGFVPPLWQVGTLALLGGILGICAMVPLRRLLIVQSSADLPYPEGKACAEVLRATERGAAGSTWIFVGLAVGAIVKLGLGALLLLPSEVGMGVPGLQNARLALELSPALLAVGFILGYRGSSVMVAGSLISAIVIVPLISQFGAGLAQPLAPETQKLIRDMSASEIWSRYVKYVGAGAVAAAGILTVVRTMPTMVQSLRAVMGGMRHGPDASSPALAPRVDRDVPGAVVLGGIALVVVVLAVVPGLFAGDLGFGPRALAALGVGIFGILFVAVSSRIVGLIGVSSNPTSGMTLVTLLGVSAIFVLLGWTEPAARATVLTVGTVVCIAASKAGDISQDLKTGFLVGATPARQQVGQFLAAGVACWAVAATVLALGTTYEFGSKELPAPQATLMRTVIEGVLSGSLPWGFVLTGSALGLTGALAGLPALSFAVGLYLPLASMATIFFGGLVRRIVDARRGGAAPIDGDSGVLCASGLIAGEGLAGVVLAATAAISGKKPSGEPFLTGTWGEIAALAVLAVCLWVLFRSARPAPR
ncbi:MAG: oligopeptide transporter, OPT family [Planctomycetes bacterium]|nr:oligopeptide transporter, OPT family [Planctomycetota bacterium]